MPAALQRRQLLRRIVRLALGVALEHVCEKVIPCVKVTTVAKYGVKPMDEIINSLTIGVLATTAGVNVETVRFYQRKGLLTEPDRPHGGIRRYGDAEVNRIKFVKSAQRLGFSLDEVAELLKLDDGTHCDEARGLAERKLADVRSKLEDLRRIESTLDALVTNCCTVRGNVSCPMISALQSH